MNHEYIHKIFISILHGMVKVYGVGILSFYSMNNMYYIILFYQIM